MSDTSFLDSIPSVEETSSLMKNIQEHTKVLQDLQWKMICAEEEYKKAEQAYNEYSRTVMPDLFSVNGLRKLDMGDGTRIAVVTKTSCSIKKDAASKQQVAKWLRQQGMGNLVKAECIVPVSQEEKLKASGITFEEQTSMNTNSVKAYLVDALGQKEAPAVITVDDIPKGINFYQWDEMEITHV